MSNNTHETQWKAYSEAWADITPAKRRELLMPVLAADCCFADPDTKIVGLDAFIAHIEKFQQEYPGAYFETRKFIEHHGQSLAEWMMRSNDGAEFLPGTSVARYGEDGRMTHIAGFWKLG